MAPAFQFHKPSGLARAQRGKPLPFLHVSKEVRLVPHFDEETKELIKIEIQVQTKGTTYRDLERAYKQLNRRAYFAERRARA